jgi:hypothetical protein
VFSKAQVRAFAAGAAVASTILLTAGAAWIRAARAAEPVEPELADSMAHLQHHTHKLMLSIEAENGPLAEFYLHEVGEVTEQIERLFPEHDGLPVARLAHDLLEPRLEALRDALAAPRWDAAASSLREVVAACNTCHAATGHAFIRVEFTSANPFNQSFAAETPRQ